MPGGPSTGGGFVARFGRRRRVRRLARRPVWPLRRPAAADRRPPAAVCVLWPAGTASAAGHGGRGHQPRLEHGSGRAVSARRLHGQSEREPGVQRGRNEHRQPEPLPGPVFPRQRRTVHPGPVRTALRRNVFRRGAYLPAAPENCASSCAAVSAPGTRLPSANTSVGVPLMPFFLPNSTRASTGFSQSPVAVGAVPFSM